MLSNKFWQNFKVFWVKKRGFNHERNKAKFMIIRNCQQFQSRCWRQQYQAVFRPWIYKLTIREKESYQLSFMAWIYNWKAVWILMWNFVNRVYFIINVFISDEIDQYIKTRWWAPLLGSKYITYRNLMNKRSVWIAGSMFNDNIYEITVSYIFAPNRGAHQLVFMYW